MEDKVIKFNKFEKKLFRIQMGNLVLSVILFVSLLGLVSKIDDLGQMFYSIVIFLMFMTSVLFIIAFVRVIKYLITYRVLDGVVFIWRSIVVLLTSPIAFAIYYVLVISLILSMASCSS